MIPFQYEYMQYITNTIESNVYGNLKSVSIRN